MSNLPPWMSPSNNPQRASYKGLNRHHFEDEKTYIPWKGILICVLVVTLITSLFFMNNIWSFLLILQ